MKKGMLVVLSGPSGSGKGTVLEQFLKDEDFSVSISATSRNPRPGDKEGVTYFFKTRDEFEKMIANDEFFEYAQFNGNYYGTPKKYVLNQINNGKNIILEIEVQGAMQVKAAVPDAVLIFMTTPNINVLRERLEGRQTESQDVIEQRLETALSEVEYVDSYDYLIINDKLEKTVSDLKDAVNSAKNKTKKNIEFIKKFKGEN
ncbi:MAG: guanylate kinase [Lachnospirales bacterium]